VAKLEVVAMPFTPFHWGPGLLVGLLCFPLLDLPVFLVAVVVVDLEPLALLLLAEPVLHAFFHSYLGATLAGLAVVPLAYLLREFLGWLLRLFGLEQSTSLPKIVVTAVAGTNFHVFLDAFLYAEMHPLFPLLGNPFFGVFSSGQVYFACIVSFVIAVPVYVFHLIRGMKRPGKPEPVGEKGGTVASDDSQLVSTLWGPLLARAVYGQQYPELLDDSQATELYESGKARHPEAAADFNILEDFVDEFLGLMFLIRARTFDDAIKRYIEDHSEASVVNLGCGLDTTFSRVDNGHIKWFDLDLPEAIEYRISFLPESSRNKCIARSVFDYAWFDEVAFRQDKGIFFIAGGLFDYFPEAQVAALCQAMAKRFPGGELIFDGSSWIGNLIMKRRLRKTGTTDVAFQLSLGKPETQIPRWSDRIEVVEWLSLFDRTPFDPRWTRQTRFRMRLSNWLKVAKIVHVRFVE
jgi:O-methyltransferase involved in polyketide biosynthesis